MNKLCILFAIVFFSLSVSSCKKDKENTQADLIIGNWRNDYTIFEDYLKDKLVNSTTSKYDNEEDYIKFNADGTGTITFDGEMLQTFNYSVSNATLYVTNFKVNTNGTWRSVDDITMSIVQLNNHEAILSTETVVNNDIAKDKMLEKTHLYK